MEVRSPAFADRARIPDRHTCAGENLSPPLSWSGVPAEARGLAVLCDDPDAPGGTLWHWAVYGLPPGSGGIPEGFGTGDRIGASVQAVTDFRRPDYGGPCPPPGHGTHHYRFRVLALGTANLGLSAGAHCREVARAAADHVVAEALLVGTYSR